MCVCVCVRLLIMGYYLKFWTHAFAVHRCPEFIHRTQFAEFGQNERPDVEVNTCKMRDEK